MRTARTTALIVSLSIAVGACGGGDSATEEPAAIDETGDTTAVGTTSEPVPGPTVEEWATSVIAAVEAEGAEWGRTKAQLEDEFDGVPEIAIRWFADACRAQAELTQRYDETMPEPHGAPNEDDLYGTYLDARTAYTAAAVDFCEAAEGSDTPSDADFEAAGGELDAAYEQLISACLSLQDHFAVSIGLTDPLLNCLGVERAFPETEEPDLEQASFTFDEISTPFTVDHDLPLDVDQFGDWVWLTNPNGFTIEFYAVDDVADPTNRGSYDGGASIPAPSSLDDWVAEMPITVIDRTETEIAGVAATRWVWELDAERIEGQTVARLWNLDSDAAPVLEAFDDETPQRVVWEVPHPDGDLLLATMLLDEPPEMLDWAETILADVSVP